MGPLEFTNRAYAIAEIAGRREAIRSKTRRDLHLRNPLELCKSGATSMEGKREMSANSLIASSVWAFLGKVAAGFIGLLTVALLARLLTPSDMGIYFLAVSIASCGAVIGKFGIDQVALREVAEMLAQDKQQQVPMAVMRLMIFGAVGALLTSCIYLVLGRSLGESVSTFKELSQLTILIAPWIFLIAMQGLTTEIFRGFHDIPIATLSGILGAAFSLIGFAAIQMAEDRATIWLVVVITIAGSLSGLLISSILLYRRLRKIKSRKQPDAASTEWLLRAWPIWITNVMVFVLVQIDIWILGYFRSEGEVAIYGAVARLASITLMATSLLYMVLPSIVVEKYVNNRSESLEEILRGGATLTALVTLPLTLVLILIPGHVLTAVYGDYYSLGGTALAFLAVGQFVHVATGMRGYVLMLTGHERLQMFISCSCGLLNVAGCTIGAIYWGVEGVAFAAMVAIAAQCLAELIGVRARLGIWTHSAFRLIPSLIVKLKSEVNAR